MDMNMIRPVSDLRNNFADISKPCMKLNNPSSSLKTDMAIWSL